MNSVSLQSRFRSWFWTALQVALGIALIGFVFSQTTIEQIVLTFQRASFPWLLFSAFVFYLQVWALARRYWILIGKRLPFLYLLRATVVQTALGNTFATSAGAASYIAIMRSQKLRLSFGIGSLILARFGDLVILTLVVSLSTAFLWNDLGDLRILLLPFIALLFACILTAGLAILFRVTLRKQIAVLAQKLKFGIPERASSALDQFASLDDARLRQVAAAMFSYSVLCNTLSILFLWCLARAFNFPVNLVGAALAVSGTQLLGLVPIHVLGGLGTIDIPLLVIFGQLHIDLAESAAFLLSFRLVFYVLNLFMLSYIPLASLWQKFRVVRMNNGKNNGTLHDM